MKAINRLYIFMLLAAMTVATTSCVNNWLEEAPYDGIPADGALQSSSDVETALVGVYKSFKGTSSYTDYYGQIMLVMGDVRGEDIQYNSVYGSNRASFYYYMNFSTASEFSRSNTPWQSPYIVIGRANRIIEAVEGGHLSDAEAEADYLASMAAEAKVLRAWALFDLTRVYGKPYTMDNGASLGVPVVTQPLESNAKPARNTVAECYAQVVADLKDAINSGQLSKSPTPGYANHWTAVALLSRVYLNMGDNANALAQAEDLINNSGYSLWTPEQYGTAWSKTDAAHLNEVIFEIAISGTTDWVDRNGVAYLYAEANAAIPGYGDVVVTKSFYDMLAADAEDARLDVLLAPEQDANGIFGDAKPYLNKYQNGGADIRLANIPLLRLSEVYLNAAEAAFALGQKDKAEQYLNAIISNRTTNAQMLVTQNTLTAERIYIERRKELVGEGQRFFDAMRRGETITRYSNDNDRGWHDVLPADSRTYNRDYYKAVSAIPQAEINANPNMEQNPGYGG